MTDSLADRVAAVRAFNRRYTQRIGVLTDGLLDSPFSLTEVRVMYELAHRKRTTASELAAELGLDAGYLSRILRGFERAGLVVKRPSPDDARRTLLALSAKGRRTFEPLERKSRDAVGVLLRALPDAGQRTLLEAMGAIDGLLGGSAVNAHAVVGGGLPPTGLAKSPQRGGNGFTGRGQAPSYTTARSKSVVLRTHRPGDIGWLVERHGTIYHAEQGWGGRFEGLVAEIAGKFLRAHDPERERCWIAELDGERVGSIVVVRKSAHVAQLRLLLVDPRARGHGIGKLLVDACIAFARNAGYRKMILWTNRGLDAAKHLYEEAGFTLAAEEPHRDFGEGLIAQVWSLRLR